MNKELINKMQETITLNKFKPIKEINFDEMDFADIVEHLSRPYIPLSKDEIKHIKSLGTDVVEYEGELFTFGKADGMDMLMPYNL